MTEPTLKGSTLKGSTLTGSRLKQRMRARARSLGGLLRLPAETLVEMAGVAGRDYILVDCEHGPADLISLRHHITAAQMYGMAVLVRVGRADPDLVLRVLDLGACGIVVPHVDTPDEARSAVRSAHYPPTGDRGFATYTSAGRFGAVSAAEHLAGAADSIVVVVMLETQDACANAAEIMAVPGVDAVMAGPADLSVAMGLSGGRGEPAVRTEIDKLRHAAADAGKPIMTIVNGVEQVATAPPGPVVYNLAHVLLSTFRSLAETRR